jgi:(+)-trans-carveol dehydrogenase
MGRVDGKVALITGAARGQGRAHAHRLALEGADIVALDICRPLEHVSIPTASPADLVETAELVESTGRSVLAMAADVRHQDELDAAVDAAYERFGHVDIVIANAGTVTYSPANAITEEEFRQVLDVNLLGVWRTCKSVVPRVVAAGRAASLVLTSSVGGLKGGANCGHYNASKHGVIGLMKTLAIEYGPLGIRVNAVCPTNVNTPMLMHDSTLRLFLPDAAETSRRDFARVAAQGHVLDVGWVEPEDVAAAALFLASDEARHITGVALPVDAGAMLA